MERAVILHGMPSEKGYHNTDNDSQSNSHWLPWLQQQLCARDILAQTPEMPRPYQPDYWVWEKEFERQIVDDNTILVGHSCGGGFLVRWLSEHPDRTVKQVILVAPWLDREKEYESLFDFTPSPKLVSQTARGIDVLYSTDDGLAMQATLAYLRETIEDASYHEFVDYGHFCLRDMNMREFPELLSICLGE